jgi:cellulose synthase/poly-beta-1,6-N-acetylglucosamine synthase-like glycosyltransferase
LTATRPSISVIVPFIGSADELADVAARFGAVGADEVLVAYNAPSAYDVPGTLWHGPRGSPGGARTFAAASASGEWLVFADADCAPADGWLDGFFSPAPGPRVALLAGAVRDTVEGSGVAARVASSVGALDQSATLSNAYLPYGVTANLAVRKEAFDAVGGFAIERRIAEDADLCWRIQRAGWSLEERPDAVVSHSSRETLMELWRQRAQNGAAAKWLAGRYPGAMPKWNLLALVRDSARQLAQGDVALQAAIVSGWWAFELGRRAPGWMAR